MKKMAVVYMAHDGFASLYSGVGTVARDFLLSFPEVSKRIHAQHPDVALSLYVATMKFNDRSFALSDDIRSATISFAAGHNIRFIELNNGSAALDAYGTYKNWQNACISGATFVNLIAADFDKVVVISVDTPFVQVANRFLDTYDTHNVEFIWLPQSTIKIHGYGMSSDANQQGDTYSDQRYKWEAGVIDLAKTNSAVRIGYVGEFMRQHLITEYGASESSLLDLRNSLYLSRLSQNVHSQAEIEAFLKDHAIPTNRPLLFSFGRAEPYKGLDLVIKNCDELIKKHRYFILIQAAPYSMDDPYFNELLAMAEEYPDDMKVVYDLSFVGPHYVMQWEQTSIVAILSRAEPFGLIPIESRFYNNPNLTLLVSDKGGLRFQIEDGKDGFVTDLTDSSIRKKLTVIAALSSGQKAEIAQRGYEKVSQEYDQVIVNAKVLEKYVSTI